MTRSVAARVRVTLRLGAFWYRLAAAAAGGAVLYLSSPPRELWWLAPLALTVLIVTVHGRTARAGFGYGFVFGVAYLLPLLRWIHDFLGPDFGPWPWFGLVVVESLFFGLTGAGIARVSRLPGAVVWQAAVVVAGEALRSRVPYGGFPWGRIAFTQADGVFLPLAALGGAVLVGFAVALTGSGLAVALPRFRARSRSWVLPALTAALPLVAGAVLLPSAGAGTDEGRLNVAVVQGNAPDVGIRLRDESATVRANHLAQARELLADVRGGRTPRPDLVVFPESAARFAADRRDPAFDRLAADLGAPMLVGGLAVDDAGRVSNRVIEWSPDGAGAEYAKRQLVPFGEFVPWRALMEMVSPFAGDPAADLVPGDRPGVFDVAGTRAGVAICYEIAYDHTAAEAVRDGARLLVVPTNNGWYGRTEMTYQQLAMARVRAVEHGRAVVVAATTGVSALVRPDGAVISPTGQFTAETLAGQVPLRSDSTLATRLGSLPEWLIAGAALAALGFSLWRRDRQA